MRVLSETELEELVAGTIKAWSELSFAAQCFSISADRYLQSVKLGRVVELHHDSLTQPSIEEYKAYAIRFFQVCIPSEQQSLIDGLDFYSFNDQKEAVDELKLHLKVQTA